MTAGRWVPFPLAETAAGANRCRGTQTSPCWPASCRLASCRAAVVEVSLLAQCPSTCAVAYPSRGRCKATVALTTAACLCVASHELSQALFGHFTSQLPQPVRCQLVLRRASPKVCAVQIVLCNHVAPIQPRHIVQLEGELCHHTKDRTSPMHGLQEVSIVCCIGCDLHSCMRSTSVGRLDNKQVQPCTRSNNSAGRRWQQECEHGLDLRACGLHCTWSWDLKAYRGPVSHHNSCIHNLICGQPIRP